MLKLYVETHRGLNADLRELGPIYRMVVVAGLRSKQLLRGSKPRITPNASRKRHVSIALEEVRRGLVHFTPNYEIEGLEVSLDDRQVLPK